MSCSKTFMGICSHCGAWWKEIRKNAFNSERCASCGHTVVVPLHDSIYDNADCEPTLESMGFVKVDPPSKADLNIPPQEVFPPEGNWCSRCHQRFDDYGICPCGIDMRTGRPFGQ